jgi:Prokaryotic E2 family E
MSDRVNAELTLLRRAHPELELIYEGSWVRLASYVLPPGWSRAQVELAFRIPPSVGVQPYGFWVHPGITLADGQQPTNYTPTVDTPFGPGWGQFSWSPEAWRPHAEIEKGDNMLHFLRSIRDRLSDLQ